MLEITEELKQSFLSPKTHKDIKLEFPKTDFSRINWYDNSSASFQFNSVTDRNRKMGLSTPLGSIFMDYLKYGAGVLVSYEFIIKEPSFASTPSKYIIGCGWRMAEGDESKDIYYLDEIPYDATQTVFKFTKRIPIPQTKPTRLIELYFDVKDANGDTVTYSLSFEYGSIHFVLLNDMAQTIDLDKNDCDANYKGIPIESLVSLNNERTDIGNANIVEKSFAITESICSDENIRFGACESSVLSVKVAGISDKLASKEFYASISTSTGEIPLGYYKIDSVRTSRKGTYIGKDITAYDHLAALNVDASLWWKRYMKAYSLDDDTAPRFGYVRQMFSTFDSLAANYGVFWNKGVIKKAVITSPSSASSLSRKIYDVDGTQIGSYSLGLTTITAPEGGFGGKIFKVSRNKCQATEEIFRAKAPNIADDGCGMGENACFLVTETTASGKEYKYLVDSNNWWAVHDDCTALSYYSPFRVALDDSSGGMIGICIGQEVSYATMPFYLPNATARLVYYNWKDKTIAEATDITALSVLRSLCEINGSFARYNRYGEFQFYRVSTQGLFPSESLYPDDTLFPVDNESTRLLKSQYDSFESEEYAVKPFGKIQITTGLSMKEYVGSAAKNVYIMGDNVFYSNMSVTYEPDLTVSTVTDVFPEVDEMLAIMLEQIKRSSYVPYTANTLGIPWVEAGDRLTIFTGSGGEETFVFRRTLSGEQTLKDALSASGDEVNTEVSTNGKDWSEGN